MNAIEKYKKHCLLFAKCLEQRLLKNGENKQMIETVPHFKDYLENRNYNLMDNLSINSCQYVANFLREVLEFLNDTTNSILFFNFENIPDTWVEESFSIFEKFSYKEKLEIIMYMIKINIERGITLKSSKDINRDILSISIKSNKKKEEAIEKRNKAQKVIFAHRVLKKHYFDKEFSFNSDDIPFISASLKALGIKENICLLFEQILLKSIKKEKKPEVSISPKIYTPINEKEIRQGYRYIMEKYDLENHKAITILTLPEIIYLVSLMKKIHVEEKEIIKFIKTVNAADLNAYQSWLRKLSDYYEKIEKYSSSNTFKELKEWLKNMFTMQNADDYFLCKELVFEFFCQALEEIKGVYEYELEKGMKM